MKNVLLVLCCILLIGISVGCTQEDAENVWTHNIYPSTNNTYTVGSPALQYQNGYFVNLSVGNTIITNFSAISGNCIYIWDADNSDYFSLCHDGGVGIIENPTGDIYVRGDDNVVADLTGDSAGMYEFQVENSGNTEVASIDTAGNLDVIGNISGKNLAVSGLATVGNVTTKALLTLASGNISAGLAPLVFTAGPLLTVPVAGAMEFDGTGIYLTPTNHRRFISLASDSMIATTNTAALIDTQLWQGIINANELRVNRVYVIKGCGLYTTHDANDRCTINMTVDSTNVVSIQTAAGLVTNQSWSFEVYFTVRAIGATGIISSHGDIETTTASSCTTWETISMNTSAINYITLNAKWSDTLNSIKLTQCWLATAD
jgi:hypothetical protein